MRTNKLVSNLSIVALAITAFISCKKEEPVPTNTPTNTSTTEEVALPPSKVTTYDGELSYTPTVGEAILTDDGSATITKTGSTYTINFSDGVPTLNGLRFKDEDGAYATLSTDGSLDGISIDGTDLDIGIFTGGNTWSFSGSY